ncbi:MAG: glycoside hydrolase family 28 protein, partial [Bacteroidota bacterium]
QVRRCRLKSDWGAIKFGTESMGDFRHIDIRDCQIHDTKGGGIKILSVDGAHIRHVVIDQIEMENTDMPIFIRLGERRLTYRDAERQEVGSINGVSISHLTASTRSLIDSRLQPPSGIFITGTPQHPIGKVSLSHIQVTLPGGGEEVLQVRELPENETKYPEFTSFGGALPAYGLFARHIRGLQLEEVRFELLGTDHREEKIVLP